MKNREENTADILKINMEAGWNCDYDCKNCYRFFECRSPFKDQVFAQGRTVEIGENLSGIKTILVSMGGKGGVGKSTLSSQLAMALAQKGYRVGIVDSDFYGPSIPKLLGIREGAKLVSGYEGILPVEGPWGIKVVSTCFLLKTNESLSWFDRLKGEALEGFLAHVCFGELDFLFVDLPPGTGLETINLFKYLPIREKLKVLIVTTPSELSQGVAHRCISLCQSIPVPILGLVENMSGFICPQCGYVTSIFQVGAGKDLARETGIPFLGHIPLDVHLRKAADQGTSVLTLFPSSPSSKGFLDLTERIVGKDPNPISDGCRSAKKSSIDRASMPEVLEMSMDSGCYGRRCDDCSRYFACTYPTKQIRHEGVRYDKIEKRMSLIKRKIAVVSGKGGVGKSTISANLALCLAHRGYRVGIIDSDFHGPCIPRLLGIEGKRLKITDDGIQPVEGPLGIKVISMGSVLDEGEPLTWFHGMKKGALGDFFSEVDYGNLDYLVIDLPPGTGPENYNVLRELPQLDDIIAVTIPSQLSSEVVKRGLSLFRQAKHPVLGVIVNMAGFTCPRCHAVTEIFSEKRGKELSEDLELPWLGDIPLDERISATSDTGIPFIVQYPDSPVTRKMNEIVDSILAKINQLSRPQDSA